MNEQDEIYNEIYNESYDYKAAYKEVFGLGIDEKRFLRKETTKARNYMQELLEPHLPCLRWDSKTLDKDTRALFVAADRYWKRHLPDEFKRILTWVKTKDLHVKQLIKLFYK